MHDDLNVLIRQRDEKLRKLISAYQQFADVADRLAIYYPDAPVSIEAMQMRSQLSDTLYPAIEKLFPSR